MKKKIISVILVTVIILSVFAIAPITVGMAYSSNDSVTLKVGEEKTLSFSSRDIREIQIMDGFIQSTSWVSYGYSSVDIVSQDFTMCTIKATSYTSLQPIVVRCDISYISYIGNYPYMGQTAVDFNVYIESPHPHELTHYDYVSPSHNSTGHTEYWYCKTCRKYFYNAGEEEISKSSTIIPKIKHTYDKKVVKATLVKNGSISYGKCFCGATKKAKKVYHPEKYKLSSKSFVYNGKTKKPKITVIDVKGEKIPSDYYSVKYTNNKKIGTAKAKITFKRKYTGTKTLKFYIKPKKPSVTVTPGRRKAVITYKKVYGDVKFQIRYSTEKSSGYKVIKTNTTSLKITKTNLKKNKSYYFRVRAYKKVEGKVYYSEWATKRVTIK